MKRTNGSSGPAPGALLPGLLIEDRRHLRLVGELLGENLPPVSRPILLAAKVDASAHERIGIKVHRLPIYCSGDEFIRRQTLHRGKTLRRIGDSHLKSRRSEQVLLLRDLLLRVGTARDTED